jgi:hypothetical protein
MIERRVFCDRCGDCILEQGSVMSAKAGEAVKRYPEPIDLCLSCLERLGDFLKSGQQPLQNATGGPVPGLQVKSTVPAS